MYPIPASKWETYPTVVEALERLVPDGSCEAAGEQLVSERAGHPKRQRRDLLALAEATAGRPGPARPMPGGSSPGRRCPVPWRGLEQPFRSQELRGHCGDPP